MPNIGLPHYLIVGALLFVLGFITVMSRRNAVGLLMGVELILNAANVNFVAFNHYVGGGVSGVGGQVMAVFGIVLAAAEAAIALAIVLALFRTVRTIDIEDLPAR